MFTHTNHWIFHSLPESCIDTMLFLIYLHFPVGTGHLVRNFVVTLNKPFLMVIFTAQVLASTSDAASRISKLLGGWKTNSTLCQLANFLRQCVSSLCTYRTTSGLWGVAAPCTPLPIKGGGGGSGEDIFLDGQCFTSGPHPPLKRHYRGRRLLREFPAIVNWN